MTEKLKCPICGAELQEFGGGDSLLLHYCDNINCNLYHIMGQYTLWQELIRTGKALDVAVDALKDNLSQANFTQMLDASRFHCIRTKCELALEQIRALEQKDVK